MVVSSIRESFTAPWGRSNGVTWSITTICDSSSYDFYSLNIGMKGGGVKKKKT